MIHTIRPYIKIGFKHFSHKCIIGFSTFSPIKLTLCDQFSLSIGSGGPRFIVVNVGASNCDISASKSTRKVLFY